MTSAAGRRSPLAPSQGTGSRKRTRSTTNLRRGAVVLVPFDSTDRSAIKWRPAAVVSGKRYNTGPDVVIASITGNLAAVPHPGDKPIRDWKAAGLLRPSLIQAKLATVEGSILGKRIGQLTAHDLAAFDHGLREALEL